jgi:hypothetical protein
MASYSITNDNKLRLPTFKEFRDSVYTSKRYGKEDKQHQLKQLNNEMQRLRKELKEKKQQYINTRNHKKRYGMRREDYATYVATLRAEKHTHPVTRQPITTFIDNKDSQKVVKKLSLLYGGI